MSTYEIKFTDIWGRVHTVITDDQPNDIAMFAAKLLQRRTAKYQDGPDNMKIINLGNIVSIDIDRVKGELNDQT